MSLNLEITSRKQQAVPNMTNNSHVPSVCNSVMSPKPAQAVEGSFAKNVLQDGLKNKKHVQNVALS